MLENHQKNQQRITVRLAKTADEIEAAQKLRYQIFYEEFSAVPSPEIKKERRDFDKYDEYADHLIVVDQKHGNGHIIGTYRLLRRDQASKCGNFYSSSEYDLTTLLESEAKLLELGRSCVLSEYRAGPVLQLLWQGIANYIMDHNIDLMFGCASLHSTDIDALAEELSYMHHYHMAPEGLRTTALNGHYINMNIIPKNQINPKTVFSKLPPLIKGYLRVGCMIGDGAVIDPVFNTTDVCVIAQSNMVTKRYKKHYNLDKARIPPEDQEEAKDGSFSGAAILAGKPA